MESMKLIVGKNQLEYLEKEGLLEVGQVTKVWTKLREMCPVLESNEAKSLQIDVIPELSGASTPELPTCEVCIAYSLDNASELAESIDKAFEKTGLSHSLLYQSGEELDFSKVEEILSSSKVMVVILTENCLYKKEVLFAFNAALQHYDRNSRVILVHDATSCPFPSYNHYPKIAPFFSEKAITFLKSYKGMCIQEVVTRVNEEINALRSHADNIQDEESEIEEDVHTRVFISHKRSTGQGIAGRLYEGLKNEYRCFLDSEAKFKLHDLRKIVECTENFLFILSEGIFSSPWCLEEVKAAVEFGKPIILVKAFTFKIPNELPNEWKAVEKDLFASEPLIWMAEYHDACVWSLKSTFGASDKDRRMTPKMKQGFIEKLERGILIADNYENSSFPSVIRALDWTDKPIKELNVTVSDDDAKWFFYQNYDVESLTISDESSIGAAGMQYLLQACPNLKQLDLSTPQATEEILKIVGEKCLHLEKLELQGENLTSTALKYLSSLKKLKSIDISDPKTLSDSAYMHFQFPELERLVLMGTRIGDQGFQYIVEGCPNIKIVEYLESSKLTKKVVKIACGLKKLEKLDISCLEKINADDYLSELIESCPSLESLSISETKTTGAWVLNAKRIPKNIDFGESPFKDEYFAHLIPLCTEEHSLQFDTNENLDQLEGVERYAGKGFKIKMLRFGECGNLKDIAFSKMLSAFSSIDILELSENGHITGESLAKLKDQSCRVKTLRISECAVFNEEGFSHMMRICSPNNLYIYNTGIQAKDIPFHDSFANVETLDITLRKSDGVPSFVSRFSNLKKLIIGSLSSSDIPSVVKSCAKLTELRVNSKKINLEKYGNQIF